MTDQFEKIIRPQWSGWIIAAALATLMVVTRLGHFGEYSAPPDASWAVFFLGGLWLRSSFAFSGFFALAFATDLAAVAFGAPTDCFSPAYAFLVPAYGALWFAGAATDRLMRAPIAIACGAATTFCIANLGMFLMANFSNLGAADYARAVIGYFPHYLLSMSVYVVVSVLAMAFSQRYEFAPAHRE